MKVQKVKLPKQTKYAWVVIGDDYLPIGPIQQYLMYLETINKSPYTLRTYAHHLKLYWEYLMQYDFDWTKVDLNLIANFILWLKGSLAKNVIYLKEEPKRSERTINQIITVAASFYEYHHHCNNIAELPIYQWRKSYNVDAKYKPLLHHITKYHNKRKSIVKLKEPRQIIETVNSEVVKQMIDACKNKRDKLLIYLLYETGCRIGQALGLRHEDIETYNNIIRIKPREDNLNLARIKSIEENTIHVSSVLMQLYCDYFLEEYGDIDSDYVFINLWHSTIGVPMSYNTVIALFRRLSKKLNIHITPHMLRHTHATELTKAGWNMAYIQKRLGHQNIQTTANIYTHLDNEDMKKQYLKYINNRDKNEKN